MVLFTTCLSFFYQFSFFSNPILSTILLPFLALPCRYCPSGFFSLPVFALPFGFCSGSLPHCCNFYSSFAIHLSNLLAGVLSFSLTLSSCASASVLGPSFRGFRLTIVGVFPDCFFSLVLVLDCASFAGGLGRPVGYRHRCGTSSKGLFQFSEVLAIITSEFFVTDGAAWCQASPAARHPIRWG